MSIGRRAGKAAILDILLLNIICQRKEFGEPEFYVFKESAGSDAADSTAGGSCQMVKRVGTL